MEAASGQVGLGTRHQAGGDLPPMLADAEMICLRADQEDLRVKLRVALRRSTSVLCFAPPGFGKTVLSAALIHILFNAGKRVIFCVHRKALIKQTAGTLAKFGVPFSYIAAGRHFNPLHRVWIASIQTLRNRLGRIKADFVFVDEAHLAAAAGWAKVANHYRELGAKIIGLSGTPERQDGKPLGDVFDEMVMGPSVRWLIDQGFLSAYRLFAPKGMMIDRSKLHSRDGEFIPAEIEKLTEGKARIKGAAKHWWKRAKGLRTIAYCESVKKAFEYAEEFNRFGIPSVALDGETPEDERNKAFIDFAEGRIHIIFNCQLFCEGFDLAAQVDRDITIECVMSLTPYKSLARHLQSMMRCMRAKPYPAVILDLVGNCAALGLPDDDREWTLEGRVKASVVSPLVECEKCGASFRPASHCPECDEPVPAKESAAGGGGRVIEEVNGDLEEVDLEAHRQQQRIAQAKAETLDELIALATARGYKSPERWAAHIWTAREATKRSKQSDKRQARMPV